MSKATTVLVLPLTETSAKIREDTSINDEDDYQLPVWAGVLPLKLAMGSPIPDERNFAQLSASLKESREPLGHKWPSFLG